MNYFAFRERQTLISSLGPAPPLIRGARTLRGGRAEKILSLPMEAGQITLRADDGTPATDNELRNQFMVFQFSGTQGEPAVLESSQVKPSIDGSKDEPDILMGMEMQCFNVGASEEIDKKTRATMRINIGKDQSSTDRLFDNVFWSIAAGLDLYNQATKKPAESKDLKADFKRAFANRPIEVPGGLAKLSFEVVKHAEPKWWQRIFEFISSGTGKSLVSLLGFPAITTQAIGVIDELLNRLDGSKPKVLFKSRPLRLALSQYARDEYAAGSTRVEVGCLAPGFCLLARGRDFKTIVENDPVFYSNVDKLVPAKVNVGDVPGGNYDDPFKDVTYAVFKVGMKKTKLDPSFNYR